MPLVKEFDARFEGKERLIKELEELKHTIMVEQDLVKASNKLNDTIEFLRSRDVLIGYSYDKKEHGNESASDGEDEMESGISRSERAAIDRAENQYP